MAAREQTLTPSGGIERAVPAGRRGVELWLLVAALGIVTAAMVIVEASQEQRVTTDLLKYALTFAVLMSAAHVAVRRWAPYADPLILPIVALLNGLGLVLIHRLDLADAETAATFGNAEPRPDAAQQVLWTAVSVVAFIAILVVVKDHRLLARFGYTFGFIGLALLAIPAVLPSSMSEVNGAKIWIRLFGFSIQPGEFAKIALIIFFAAVLVAKRDLFMTAGRHMFGMDLPRARDLGPILLAWIVSVGVLVFEKDLGSSLLLFGTVLVMIYIATERAAWVAIGLALLLVGFFIAYQLFGHVRVRVSTWIDPFGDYADTGYQISQALFGLATGGLAGTGLGSGRPSTVPFAKTDFIISTIGEELGLIGLAAVLLLFLILVIRGIRTALNVRDSFGKLLAAGLSFTIAIQVFVVVGGVTKLIPLTGLTTPFVSYGGSSLLANYVLVAILIKISSAGREPNTGPGPRNPPIADAPTEMVRR